MQHTQSFSIKLNWLALACLAFLFCLPGCGALDPPAIETHDESALQLGDIDEQRSADVLDTASVPLEASAGESAEFSRDEALLAALTIFALAVFVGFEVIAKVPPTLHTPLMSGSNAISGITLVGAVLMASGSGSRGAMFFGLLAVILATINVMGGFVVTDRMLSMFKRK